MLTKSDFPLNSYYNESKSHEFYFIILQMQDKTQSRGDQTYPICVQIKVTCVCTLQPSPSSHLVKYLILHSFFNDNTKYLKHQLHKSYQSFPWCSTTPVCCFRQLVVQTKGANFLLRFTSLSYFDILIPRKQRILAF